MLKHQMVFIITIIIIIIIIITIIITIITIIITIINIYLFWGWVFQPPFLSQPTPFLGQNLWG